MKSVLVLAALALLVIISDVSARYQPTWESIDSRPNPQWYDEAKFGIFIHWGVFSVPSFFSEWFWQQWWTQKNKDCVNFMKKNYKPDFTYQDFAKEFKAEFFDAETWVKLFQDAGAKYLVFVSKHHEGYTNWPSKYSYSWNSMDVGPRRDIVGELANATRQYTDMKFGLYHSLFEWYHPLWIEDSKNGHNTQYFVDGKTMPELHEIVEKYKPAVLWSDGDWDANSTYWRSKEFLAWLYNDSPVKDTVVVNDRWGDGWCKHGGTISCGDNRDPRQILKRKWVNSLTIDKWSWGYRRLAPASDYRSSEELIKTLVRTVSYGGNMLLNIGPPSHGHISPIFEERLRDVGAWLKINGEGIYKSTWWTYQNETAERVVRYTLQKNGGQKDVYAYIDDWPAGPTLTLTKPKVASTSKVTLLGYDGSITYKTRPQGGIDINVSGVSVTKLASKHVWTFKITDVQN